MLLFDIGANRGDAVAAGLAKGFDKIVAIEAAPRVFKELVKNFIYHPAVIPIRYAVAETTGDLVEFYECVEDGLSTLDKEWLTNPNMPYNGKEFRTVAAKTITVDRLVELYGKPDLIKVDVEGAEWAVFRGMTKHHGTLAFEWTFQTLDEHNRQTSYLQSLGYTEIGMQFIVNHLEEPKEWVPIKDQLVSSWVLNNAEAWETGGWNEANLRPTADVGMCWVR